MNENEDLPAKKKSFIEYQLNITDDERAGSDNQDVAEVIDLTQPAVSYSFSQRALSSGDTMCRRIRSDRLSTSRRNANTSRESLNRSEKRNGNTSERGSCLLDRIAQNGESNGRPLSPRRHQPSAVAFTPKPHSRPRREAVPTSAHAPEPKRMSPKKTPSVQTISSESSSSCREVESPEDDDLVVTRVERYALPDRLVTPDFKKLMQQCKYIETDWLKGTQSRVRWLCEENKKRAKALQEVVDQCERSRKAHDEWLSQQTMRVLRLSRKLPTPVEEPYIEIEEEEDVVEISETVLPPITDSIRQRVRAALASPPNAVLSDAFRLQVTGSELATLRPREWLSDMVINFYMQLIAERSTQRENLPSAYPMTTFFYPKLQQAGFAGVRRWTRKVDIFAHDLVLVPVHLGHHWCFALIQMKEQKISYFDSMQNPNNECLSQLLQYLIDEAREKKGITLDVSEWSVENSKLIPVQKNGYDCGVFTCQFAEYLSRGAALTFTQENMPYFRERMIFEILEKKMML